MPFWAVKPLNIRVILSGKQGHGLRDEVKREVLKELAKRYQRGPKKEKKTVLEEFISLTGIIAAMPACCLATMAAK